ncbi:hemerythrin family protein [Sedimentibacter sp.]|uniref:bacteriohemerythrin n=1 Tax=Sedimentibacter sp. TaxID=1960295 RepID=UPI00289863DA|nr:hemerythrin family protein [Sedimentibacter sp.]
MFWKDKYEVGVELIDNQHKELFRRVEDCIKTIRSTTLGEEKAQKVNETLEFMKEYVVEHFRDEEEYQIKIGYPDYEKHKQIHDSMVSFVLEVSEEYEKDGYNDALIQKFAGRLLTWLINHVAAEDQKIADYAVKKGGI